MRAHQIMKGRANMKLQKANIGAACIEGLEKEPYYFEHWCYWASDIRFSDTPCIFINHICQIKMGDTLEEAKIFWNQLKESFAKVGIVENVTVSVLFENNGDVIAIGSPAGKYWIDVRDKFKVKALKELDITFDALKAW